MIDKNYTARLTTQQSVVFRHITYHTKSRLISLSVRAFDKKLTINKADYGMFAMIMYGARIGNVEEYLLRVLRMTTYTVS